MSAAQTLEIDIDGTRFDDDGVCWVRLDAVRIATPYASLSEDIGEDACPVCKGIGLALPLHSLDDQTHER